MRHCAEDIENKSIAEANRFIAEARKKKEEEDKRKKMEEMVKSMPLKRGQLVRICGLVKECELNGTIATFMGIALNKRYAIGLYGGREIALKKENFVEWDESQMGEFINEDITNHLSKNNT